ncbi:RICIN domain-containing protein [Terracoccus sp. 273MFTsu3.1]|uniref:RICIN domain-containing protein n=1 Tax=Terracoccus sp. 273MFTsu3.1 TaxID=1172188 RepID=UPI000377D49A|nr:RICIN domain-containing protein [Terracoccus sp. 273MFTsu3.1]
MSSFKHTARRGVSALAGAAVALSGLVLVSGPARAADAHLGDVTAYSRSGDTYTFGSGVAKLRVKVDDTDLLRVQVAPDGTFTDPASADPADPSAPDADIVVKRDYAGGASSVTDTGTAYVISTAKARLTVTKSPITLRLQDASGAELMRETAPLAWNASGMTQTLARGAQEQFFGGGMQNGRFSHRDTSITISRDYNWDDGGNPNAAPFYLSSAGYGVLRNTFAPGTYDFHAPVRTTHQEQRFDAYYFVGDTRQVLDGYTELTGRPLMLPMYALEVGDADCYLHNANRGERRTLRDTTAIADGYAANRMPLGWTLVNDGYGCGYEDLPETHDMLVDHGSELGLWTQSDLTNQPYEVASGVRVRKTDVAWVGPGYRFALDACEKARDGIESGSTDRATVLTIEGWAGTQRCGAMWSGDQSGSWDYIKWQIPTYAGSTLSGQHVTTGDIDGIFGGSADTYTRDLQWKMFLPMTYAMSGWAAKDKQPYRYGEPYTSINRSYLELHERLLPYLYTHTVNGSRTGLGPTRPLYANYPKDPATWGDTAKYEFLAGDDFLVAPVYSDTTVRDGIYLPEGTWVDYWTGRLYSGKQTVNGYKAPLDRLPLFVRAGAVVPMFPEGSLDWQAGKDSGRLDLDVYPSGTSTFTNYEDDGRSQAWKSGASASQRFDVAAPATGKGPVTVTLGSVNGSYAGKPASRGYDLAVHTNTAPSAVAVDGAEVGGVASASALDAATSGWFYDAATGVVRIKTASVSTGATHTVRITGAGAVGGAQPGELDAALDVTAPVISVPGEGREVSATFTNSTGKPVQVTSTSVGVPAGWTATPSGPTTATDLKDGGTFTARFRVTPPAGATPGSYAVTASAAYTVRDVSRTVTDTTKTRLAFSSLASAFSNVGVTALADPTKGDIDGGGSSFIAERLAAQGVSPGSTVTANGFDFTWPTSQPGTKDNVASAGETIQVSGRGNALAFLGTGTSGSAAGAATVHYADGSSAAVTVGFPNWCCLATDTYGAKTAVTTMGKNTPSGAAYPTVAYRLYTKTVRLDPAKEVAAVTLPANSAVHVFAMTVGTEDVVPPPIADGQYSLGNVGSGLALEAPGSSSAQLGTAAVSSSASQKWVVTLQDSGAYQVKNAQSGQCMDVFSSSQTSGALVGQYTCTGTTNQQWTITRSGTQLKLTAKHSGLSLAVDGSGKVVQVTDTGATTQRWTATAN